VQNAGNDKNMFFDLIISRKLPKKSPRGHTDFIFGIEAAKYVKTHKYVEVQLCINKKPKGCGLQTYKY
jgi:hypothetical protein